MRSRAFILLLPLLLLHFAYSETRLCAQQVPAASHKPTHRLRVMAYNTENLFDTLYHAPHDDASFTPQGEHHWDTKRYRTKLAQLARLIAAVGGAEPPAIVGLCEVENDSVLFDLTRRTRLARFPYAFRITHGSDVRGMNVGLLYDSLLVHPLYTESLAVPPPSPKSRTTRDILHFAAQVISGDTLHVFVCHLPSRRGGAKRTDSYRLRAAEVLRTATESLQKENPHAKIILLGDFNASYPDVLFTQGLQCALYSHTAAAQPQALFLLSHALRASDDIVGTYKFQHEWQQIDHCIVSRGLLPEWAGNGLQTSASDCHIADFPFLLRAEGTPSVDTRRRNLIPYRTYLGTFYQGGLSDHLPLYLDLFY